MKRKVTSITVFVIGLLTLGAGIVFLILALTRGPEISDGEFLVTNGKWVLENEEGVVWDFTEIGKGALTTNDHLNDYDFIWAIKDGKLLVETDWLYELEDEYDYSLDRGGKVLTLKKAETEVRFLAEEDKQ